MAEFQTQMANLRDRLGEWANTRSGKVKEAYLTVRGNGLFYLVVASNKEYDESLESDLTTLDIDVANDTSFNLIRLEVLAIPNSPADCVEAFLGSSGKDNGG